MNEQTSVSTQQSKRDFLKYVLGGGIAGLIASILYPIFAYLNPPKQTDVEVSTVKIGNLSDIPKDSGNLIRFGNKPVLLIRTPAGDLRAFDGTCTHLDCTVQYRADMGVIWCACHNGKYDLNGRNIAGPPPRPLDEFNVIVQGEEVWISKKG